MSFTRSEVKELRKDLEAFLSTYKGKYELRLKNAKFGVSTTFQLEVLKETIDKNGKVKYPTEYKAYLDYAFIHELPKEVLNKEFKLSGKTYKILGYKSKARKYSILYSENGKEYVASPSYIKRFIQKAFPELSL